MSGRRSGRMPTITSPLAVLDALAPGHKVITGAMAGLAISGEDYAALDRAREALDRLAADLRRPGHFAARGP